MKAVQNRNGLRTLSHSRIPPVSLSGVGFADLSVGVSRYQYIVKHIGTNERRRFGINHFEEHMGFPASLIKDIKKGFTNVDYELDQILTKIKEDWNVKNYIEFIPEDMLIPEDIQKQLRTGLPLLDSQLNRLKKRIDEHLQPDIKTNNNEPKYQEQNEEIFQFDLFTDSVLPSANLNKATSVLTDHHKKLILHYLESTGSARIISELLIKKHAASPGRYLTGKPRLYLPICMYLDELVELSIVALIEKRGKDDRIYRLIPK